MVVHSSTSKYIKIYNNYNILLIIFLKKHRGFWAYVENIILSISEKGISFIHPKSKQVLKKYLYSALKGYWNIEEDTASVLVLCITEKGDDDDDVDEVKEEIFQFITEQSEEIALLIREYCPHTTNKVNIVFLK